MMQSDEVLKELKQLRKDRDETLKELKELRKEIRELVHQERTAAKIRGWHIPR